MLRCGDLGLDDHFFDVGGHSVLAQQVVFQLQQRIDPAAGPGVLFDCPTVRSLAAALEARAEGRATCPRLGPIYVGAGAKMRTCGIQSPLSVCPLPVQRFRDVYF